MEYFLLLFWLLFIIFGCVILYVSMATIKRKSPSSKIEKTIHHPQTTASTLIEKTTYGRAITLPFWLYLIAITIAELLTIYIDFWAGLICYGLILVSFLVQPSFIAESQRRDLILGLSLIPIIRIISLSMPLSNLPRVYWFLLIYIPLLASTVVVMRILGLKPAQVGLIKRSWFPQIILGIVTGFAFGTLEYLILRPEPYISSFSLELIWLPAIIIIVTTGFVEEMIFRGVLQRLAEPAMGLWGIVYISLIFAILHIGFFSVLDVIFVMCIALFYAAIVKRTGSLIGVILSHGTANVVLFLVAPFILG